MQGVQLTRSQNSCRSLGQTISTPRLHTPVILQSPYKQFAQCRDFTTKAAADDPEASANQPGESPSSSPQKRSAGAYAIPAGVPTAGAVFVLAGFLKLLIMCFPFSTMAISLYLQGRADLGTWAVVKMLPLALGVLALAKYIVDNKEVMARKWFHRTLVVGSIVALVLSRLIFARPKPSVLDPVINQVQRERIARVMEFEQRQNAAAAAAEKLATEGRKLRQPTQQERDAVAKRSRFD